MPNECRECGAKLANNHTECAYCGTVIYDENEQLLMELTAVARKYNESWVKGNSLVIEKLLADEYESRLLDAGTEILRDKKTILQNAQASEHILPYNLYDAELIERKNDRATIRCIQSFTHYQVLFEKEIVDSEIKRGTISFVRRGGHWQLISENTVSIDEKGNEISFE